MEYICNQKGDRCIRHFGSGIYNYLLFYSSLLCSFVSDIEPLAPYVHITYIHTFLVLFGLCFGVTTWLRIDSRQGMAKILKHLQTIGLCQNSRVMVIVFSIGINVISLISGKVSSGIGIIVRARRLQTVWKPCIIHSFTPIIQLQSCMGKCLYNFPGFTGFIAEKNNSNYKRVQKIIPYWSFVQRAWFTQVIICC